jgi:hypothetical protein
MLNQKNKDQKQVYVFYYLDSCFYQINLLFLKAYINIKYFINEVVSIQVQSAT